MMLPVDLAPPNIFALSLATLPLSLKAWSVSLVSPLSQPTDSGPTL